jgi:hypothetical protein
MLQNSFNISHGQAPFLGNADINWFDAYGEVVDNPYQWLSFPDNDANYSGPFRGGGVYYIDTTQILSGWKGCSWLQTLSISKSNGSSAHLHQFQRLWLLRSEQQPKQWQLYSLYNVRRHARCQGPRKHDISRVSVLYL